MSYDVVIVGSGVVGLFVAYELVHYDVRVLVIDKNAEPGLGVSKGACWCYPCYSTAI